MSEINKGFERVCEYTNNTRVPMFGEFVDAKVVLAYTRSRGENNTTNSGLPWGVVERGDLPWMSGFLLDRAFDAIGWGRGAQIQKQKQQEREQAMDPEDLERKRKMEAAIRSQRIRGALTVVGGVATFLGYCFWSGLLQIQVEGQDEEDAEEEEEEEEDIGDLKGEDDEENEDGYIDVRQGGPGGYGLAGAILGLSRPPMNPNNLNSEGKAKGEENLSPEEEDEIAEDIHAEEVEVDEAIAEDVEEDIKGKN